MREQHDPITAARAQLIARGVAEAELKQIEDETKALIQDAADFAQSSPEPDPRELWTDILLEA
jgi:pyruvate dehydrogenase E1 component alpha subunit